MAYFDRSGYLGRSDRNDPFHLTKLLSPVPIFFFYLAYKNTRGGLGRVCATGTYRSIGHVELPKFQTWIFVEWNARLLYRVPVSHCFPTDYETDHFKINLLAPRASNLLTLGMNSFCSYCSLICLLNSAESVEPRGQIPYEHNGGAHLRGNKWQILVSLKVDFHCCLIKFYAPK